MKARSAIGIATLALGLTLPVSAVAADAVGQVTSANGKVVAIAPDGAERTLSCGDSIYDGDTLSTGAQSSVGVLSGDYLTQVADRSAVQFGQTGEGAPDAVLERGQVRVIDVREGGGTARLAAGDAEVRVVGNDAEAYLLSEKLGPYAMFCEWDAPLDVVRRQERELTDPGHCVIAKPREPLYVADAHEARIPTPPADQCPPDLGALASTDPHFTPADTRDVAAPPPPIAWSNLPNAPGPPNRHPCEQDPSACALSSSQGGGIIVINEPPPIGDPSAPPFPGAN